MKLLVKLGGTLLDSPEERARLAGELAATEHPLVIVHGGGKQMTRFLAERGVESRFVNGLRVTTPETIDAVLKVFAGSVNHGLVFLTDVEGVLGADGNVIQCLTAADARRLIAGGVATGGMQAKLEAACSALQRGVGQVVIAPGAAPGAVGRLLAGARLGTRVIGVEVR